MLSCRAGVNLASAFARNTVAKRVGHQFARRSYATTAPIRRSNLLFYAGIAGAGVGLHAYSLNDVYCDSREDISLWSSACVNVSSEPTLQQTPPVIATPPSAPKDSDLPPPPASTLNLYELTFGSVCGICAGILIKKGAKFVAFMLGAFLLLQVIQSCKDTFLSLILPSPSTSGPPPSSESTGLVPRAVSRTCSIGRRMALDAHPRSDPSGIGSSAFWVQTSSHGILSRPG